MNVRRGRDFVGLPVVRGDEREAVGEVQDVIVGSSGELLALAVLPAKGLLRKERIVPWSAIRSVSPQGVYLRDPDQLFQADSIGEPSTRLYCREQGLCGRSLLDEQGEEIGVIGDVIFDGEPLHIWGFEVSDGILRDLLDGRPVVEAAGATLDGENVVLKSRGRGHMNLLPIGHPNS